MEKEDLSSNNESKEEYNRFQPNSPIGGQSNGSGHPYGNENFDSGGEKRGGRPLILPPSGAGNGSHHSSLDSVELNSNTNGGSNTINLTTTLSSSSSLNKKKRPRILAPPQSSSGSDTYDDDEVDNGSSNRNGGVINFQTRRARKFNRSADGSKQPRSRYFVRINDDSCRSRSASPLRQVIVDQPLDNNRYSRKCRNYEDLGYCLAGNNCPFFHGPNTIVVDGLNGNSFVSPVAVFDASIRAPFNNSGVTPFGAQPPLALVGAPPPPQPLQKRRSTCSLLVRNIPPGCANIAKINEYFGRFGTVQHIQVSFGGRPDEALIRYADVESAVRAYRCQEPIFSNRFVHLRWWYDENAGAETMPIQQQLQTQQQPCSFGIFSTLPSVLAAKFQNGAPVVQSRNLSKTYGTATTTTVGRSVTFTPMVDVDPAITVSSSTQMQSPTFDNDNDAGNAVADLVQSAQQSRDCSALRPLSKRFTARTKRSLELKTEQERLLGAKTDLYLKLSEQVRIVLLNAKAAIDVGARQRWLKMVSELQTNMRELADSISQLYASVYPGRRALDIGAIVSERAAGGTQAV